MCEEENQQLGLLRENYMNTFSALPALPCSPPSYFFSFFFNILLLTFPILGIPFTSIFSLVMILGHSAHSNHF